MQDYIFGVCAYNMGYIHNCLLCMIIVIIYPFELYMDIESNYNKNFQSKQALNLF
jgi:hypothetical protein